jgi:hypothetical protein
LHLEAALLNPEKVKLMEENDIEIVNFEFKEYSSKQELFDYTLQSDYIIDDSKPGVCFGYQIVSNSDTDFEL